MKVFYSDHFRLPLPEGHRFPMAKYSRLRERVMEAALVAPDRLMSPHAATDTELSRAHAVNYIQRVEQGRLSAHEVRALGFPWSPQLVQRSRRSSGATIEACRTALVEGYGVNLAGGTHHAFRDRGEGYCVFNDSAVAALTMIAEGRTTRIIIIDCDVHQGNGTASILAEESDVFTFSIHGQKNFPVRKERSDLDIALPDGTGDRDYLKALDRGLCSAFRRFPAGLAIYLAGADPYEDDGFGRLSLSKPGLLARDRLVLDRCEESGVPVAVTMAGGYARRMEDTVDLHFQTVEEVARRSGR